MATTVITLYRPVIDHMRGWDGDIGRAVHRLADNIAVSQRVFAPKKTGKLWASIEVGTRGRGPRGIQIKVGANPGQRKTGYAYWTSEGAAPHMIYPRAGNRSGYLRFYWVKVGAFVRFRSVSHPGIRNPTHWVMRGAEAGMAGWFG